MSYTYKVIEDFPLVAYPMSPGETTGFVDVSGNALNATNYGTLAAAPPLVSGGGNSYIVNDLNGFSFAPGIFTGADSRRPFALEAWFKHKDSTGTIQIVGHNHAGDGITWNGDAITFTTMHGTAGNCSVSFYPQDVFGAFHVVGVHTQAKNQLFVNGTLAAESEMTAAQQLAAYTVPTNPGVLYSGHVISGAGSVIVDSVAIYDRSLSESQIYEHFIWGHRVADIRTIVAMNNGLLWTFLDDNASLILNNKIESFAGWDSGLASQVYISDNLYPSFNNSVTSVAGTWSYGLILEALQPTLDGSKIEWDGDGTFTVESSLNNGTSWSACTNGLEIPGISKAFSTTSKTLTIRISFPAGLAKSAKNVIRSLTVKLYNSRDIVGWNNSRKITTNGSVSLATNFHQPIEMHDETGIDIYNGSAVLQKDLDAAPTIVRTVEFWFKLNGAASSTGYILDARDIAGDTVVRILGDGTRSGGILYINGAAWTAAPFNTNQWYHAVFVMTADNAKNITLGASYVPSLPVGPISFGNFVTYQTALSAASATQLYNAYLGITGISVLDTNTITVLESATPAKAYTFNWSITSAG